MKRNRAADVAQQGVQIATESKQDYAKLRNGQMDEGTYWDRVHARDAQVREMSPEDRAVVNSITHDDVK